MRVVIQHPDGTAETVDLTDSQVDLMVSHAYTIVKQFWETPGSAIDDDLFFTISDMAESAVKLGIIKEPV